MILNNIPSLYYFSSELIITLGVLLLLIVAVYKNVSDIAIKISIGTVLISFILILPFFDQYATLFLGNIVIDPYSNFFKLIFLFTVFIVIILTYYDGDV